jgi:DNA-binding SARP family transcriptional activator/EAL domain-containing protein (putative c-di-GMP-specific phosphodiesterase class I)
MIDVGGQGTVVRLLGRLSIERPGVPSATVFPGRRPELVFAYLAAEHHRDVSRDELADALWPQELPDAWASALRGVVSDVRRVISAGELGASGAGELLERTGIGYRLRLPADAVLDLDEVRAGLANARERVAKDPAGAAVVAAGAADLARLSFLPRHEGEWVDRVRGEIEGMLVEALELAARGYMRAGGTRAAAAAATRLIEAEPYSDAAHRLRIEVLAAGGDRAGAARAYEECRARLAEIGVEPSTETEAAQRMLVTPPPSGVSTAAPPAPAPAASPFATLSVLVVDDHDFQRRTALALLSRLGVGALAEAPDGAAALELLAHSEPPDVIVCDIDMPGMDGVEFIRHVAERRLASAVLIASGLERSVLQAVEAVGEGYGVQVLGAIEKPLTARRLTEVLNVFQRPARARSLGDRTGVTDAELRAALEGGRIGARFSPIVDLQVGVISGAEALAAWSRAPGEPPALAAGQFSESLGAALADRMLALVCAEQLELTAAGREIPVWTRLARGALGDVAHADRLLGVVRERHADPRRIVFTVSERAVRRSTAAELDVLTRLRVKGFGICLEDYGRVSAEALTRIPLTAVALAPELVRGAYNDAGRAAALEEALESIRAVGLPAVARGCDGAADYELLLQIGCGHGHGEFIARAVAAGELADWADGWSPPSI